MSPAVAALALAVVAAAAPTPPGIVLRHLPPEATGVTHRIVCGSHVAKTSILEENGSGLALFDYDGDGDLDLYLVNGGTLASATGAEEPPANALYRNDGGWRFVDVTDAAGVGDRGWGTGVAVGDVDGDGDRDLLVTNHGPDVLFRNRGDGSFAAEPLPADGGWGHSAAFFDADGDGDLDLYVAHNLAVDPARPAQEGRPCEYRGLAVACGPVGFPAQPDRLYANDGRGRFTDVSAALGVHAPEARYGLGVVAADLDLDGRPEIAVANDSGPNFLFVPRAEGGFAEEAWLAGVAVQAEGRAQAGMGIDAADADGDGRLDLVLTHFALDHSTLYLAAGDGLWRDVSYPSGLGGATYEPMSWGVRFVDLDHDGDLDLYVANGHLYPEVAAAGQERFAQPDQVFANGGVGHDGVPRFAEEPAAILRDGPPGVSRGAAFGDLDGDGDGDVAVVELEAPPALYRNDSPPAPWLGLALSGAPGADAELATAVAVVAGRRLVRQVHTGGSYASASEPTLRFGLAGLAGGRVSEVEVRRPSGRRQVVRGLPVGRLVVVPEPRPAAAGGED